jgi:hypothetical protein
MGIRNSGGIRIVRSRVGTVTPADAPKRSEGFLWEPMDEREFGEGFFVLREYSDAGYRRMLQKVDRFFPDRDPDGSTLQVEPSTELGVPIKFPERRLELKRFPDKAGMNSFALVMLPIDGSASPTDEPPIRTAIIAHDYGDREQGFRKKIIGVYLNPRENRSWVEQMVRRLLAE